MRNKENSNPDPKGFTYTPIYEPDKKRMLEALKILFKTTPVNTDKDNNSQ